MSAPPFRDRLIPWYFAGGMAVVIIANACLIYFAVSTWSGLSVERAYQRGLEYNRAIASAAHQDALGWSIDLVVAPGAGMPAAIATARGNDGAPLQGLTIELELSRPVGVADVRNVTLQSGEEGRYVADIPGLPRGQWDVKIEARLGTEVWRATRRTVLP